MPENKQLSTHIHQFIFLLVSIIKGYSDMPLLFCSVDIIRRPLINSNDVKGNFFADFNVLLSSFSGHIFIDLILFTNQ